MKLREKLKKFLDKTQDFRKTQGFSEKTQQFCQKTQGILPKTQESANFELVNSAENCPKIKPEILERESSSISMVKLSNKTNELTSVQRGSKGHLRQ